MIREIVKIDEDKCDGCGLCIPNCHEGALKIIDGKARVVSDVLCDGLGDCIGHCPQGAITVEQREAEAFDEEAVAQHLASNEHTPGNTGADSPAQQPTAKPTTGAPHGGCPGSRFMQFARDATAPSPSDQPDCAAQSQLTHWPVQLGLLPPMTPALKGARLLLAADCVPIAYPDFHAKLLKERAVAIGCPKFDDVDTYIERLTEMIKRNDLREVVVARMQVPCCMGIVMAAEEARKRAGVPVPLKEIVIGVDGSVVAERTIPIDSVA